MKKVVLYTAFAASVLAAVASSILIFSCIVETLPQVTKAWEKVLAKFKITE